MSGCLDLMWLFGNCEMSLALLYGV